MAAISLTWHACLDKVSDFTCSMLEDYLEKEKAVKVTSQRGYKFFLEGLIHEVEVIIDTAGNAVMPFNVSRSNTPVTLVSQASTTRATCSRSRRMSENFYEEGGGADIADGYRTPVPTDTNDQVKKYHTRQSKKLPHWAWRILVTLLDIKQSDNDKVFIGKIVFFITGAFAAVFTGSYIWYTVYDIYSEFTKSTALTGTVSIVIVLFYCGLGLYAHRLARNLFRSKKLVESVRLHSKTIFKISASFLLILLGVAIVTMNNLSAHATYTDAQCRNVSLSVYVCRTLFASRVGYSVLNLFWNVIVGFVVLSVCRTHTIGIRRFIRELEDDGRVYEQLFRQEIMDQLQQLTKSGDFSASVGQSTMYTAEDDNFLSSREDEEDPWADDDPLVEELTFYPRPSAATRVQLAQSNNLSNSGGLPAFSKRRMLMKQASVSSINRNQSERSYGVYNTTSRRNSLSSQEDDVFTTESPRQITPRSFDRHHLAPMETLVERSTENLNMESTPLNPERNNNPEENRINPELYYQGYGAIGGKPNSSLERHFSEPVTGANFRREEYRVAGTESTLRYSEDTLKAQDEESPDEKRQENRPKVQIQEMTTPVAGSDMQITEDYFDNDTELLIKSVSDNEGLYQRNSCKRRSSKSKKIRRRHSKTQQGGSCMGTRNCTEEPTEGRGVTMRAGNDGKAGGVDINSVIDSLEGRKSVDGAERDMKDKFLTYISSQSSDSEGEKVKENLGPTTAGEQQQNRPLDTLSLESWDQGNLLLTNEEIFLAYWKISCRLRSTSLALQRWLVMWVFFILLWCAAFLVELVTHDSNIVEIGQFILTIILIPLVCSAYGEVNNEGSRLIKCICPMPCRVDMLFILNEMPLTITAFGFVVSYATIVKTLGALGLAFFTKLILDDINW